MTATHLESGPPALVWPGLATARAERAGEPAWALAQRRAAAATAARLPFPDRALELWRRTDFGALPLASLDPFAGGPRARHLDDLPAPIIARLAGEAERVGLMVQRGAEVVFEHVPPAL